MRLRFTPRPDSRAANRATGAGRAPGLDLADARWALLAASLAEHAGGALLLMLDDRGGEPEAPAPMLRDLDWLGLGNAETLRRGERLARYAEAADRLRAAGRLYPCFESEAELQAKADRRRRRGEPTTYDRAMLRLTSAQRAAAEAGGKRPYWRFHLDGGVRRWPDPAGGTGSAPLDGASDPVLVREDGTALALFAGVVDDLDGRVTHALRPAGEEVGTALLAELRAALAPAARPLAVAHIPAFRPPTPSLRRLRADGIEAAALAAWLCGAPPPTWRRLATLPAAFDAEALRAANRHALAALPFAAVADRLPPGATERFWDSVRGRIELLADAREFQGEGSGESRG